MLTQRVTEPNGNEWATKSPCLSRFCARSSDPLFKQLHTMAYERVPPTTLIDQHDFAVLLADPRTDFKPTWTYSFDLAQPLSANAESSIIYKSTRTTKVSRGSDGPPVDPPYLGPELPPPAAAGRAPVAVRWRLFWSPPCVVHPRSRSRAPDAPLDSLLPPDSPVTSPASRPATPATPTDGPPCRATSGRQGTPFPLPAPLPARHVAGLRKGRHAADASGDGALWGLSPHGGHHHASQRSQHPIRMLIPRGNRRNPAKNTKWAVHASRSGAKWTIGRLCGR